jgi:DNA-binding LacI/PurR family transcriptional regulator
MSIRAIAKKTGVSVATVSRVLNRSSAVNAETRQKVLEAMGQTNFAPKRPRKRFNTVGVTITDFRAGRLNYAYIREFMVGAMEEAARFDTAVKIISLDELVHIGPKLGSCNDFCKTHEIDALVHVQTPVRFHGQVERVADEGISQVVIEHQFSRTDIGWIDIDNYSASYTMAEYLLQLGRKRFAVVTASREFPAHRDRCQGFLDAVTKAGLTVRDEWNIERQHARLEAGSSAIMNLLAGSKEPPDAVYFTNVELALGGVRTLADQGVKIPQAVIPCIFDDSHSSPWVFHPVIYLSQPAFELGAKSVHYLLTHKPGETLQKLIKPELFISPEITPNGTMS